MLLYFQANLNGTNYFHKFILDYTESETRLNELGNIEQIFTSNWSI
jgi:hypothetical protein